MADYFLLGPQRPTVTLGAAFDTLDERESVAVISAGWQEAEGDIDDVHEIVKRPLVDLKLYQRAEEILASESWLRELHRERQDRLQELQRLYRLRLAPSMSAARSLLRTEGDPEVLVHEQRHAISQQRVLDRHHLRRIRAIHFEFDTRIANEPPPALVEHRAEVADILTRCQTIIISGGNVAVLLNRLRLFDLGPSLAAKNIVAWSAGAMVLADKVVLFHDHTPQGDRDAEVFDSGLGFLSNFVFLPDARHRLALKDKIRVGLFCRRFAPAACLTLDSGSSLQFKDRRLVAAVGAQRLSRDGKLKKVRTQ